MDNLSAKDPILVLMSDGKDFEDALKGINEELKADFDFKEKRIEKKTDVRDIQTEINSVHPKVVVLMDNSAKRECSNSWEYNPKNSSTSISSLPI